MFVRHADIHDYEPDASPAGLPWLQQQQGPQKPPLRGNFGLVHGSGYERIASAGCSDRTIRRRLKDWAERGIGQQVHALALAAYDQIIGLELADVAVDGCRTKAPCGGPLAGPSPVDRRKGGLKRSVATEAAGIPLGIAAAGA